MNDFDPFKEFRAKYPTPVQLESPLRNFSRSKYDVFSNFHMTYNACQLGIKYIRNGYAVVARGWLPDDCMDSAIAITYSGPWSTLFKCSYIHDAITVYKRYALELLNMSQEKFNKFRHLASVLRGVV